MTNSPSRDPFRSDRLIYRAVETPEDNEVFEALHADPVGFINSNARLKTPQSKKDASHFQKFVAEDALLGVVICLPSHSQDENAPLKPTPIGQIHLTPLSTTMAVHRHADIGIDVLKQYQGQGYGSEAIRWGLKWAFEEGGLHRVGICAFEYNEGALRLYERLGFKREGVHREYIYHGGRWWDDVHFSMLDREWAASSVFTAPVSNKGRKPTRPRRSTEGSVGGGRERVGINSGHILVKRPRGRPRKHPKEAAS